MAINKMVRAALKALSYPDIEIKRNYKLARQMVNVTNYQILRSPYRTWDECVSVGGHQIPVRIFSPVKGEQRPFAENRLPVLLFFHGGGWVTGNIDSYSRTCTHMAMETNRLVISVDYRLAPEYKFPAAPEDCYLVARALFRDSQHFGIDPEQITLIGDSAGGNLAAVVSLMARDRGEFLPKRQILIYPATYNDHTATSPYESVIVNGNDYLLTAKRIEDYMDLYRSSLEDLKNPYFAPLLAKDLTRQPETLIITAQYDPLRDEGEAYGKRLEEAGIPVEIHRVEDALHGFFTLPGTFSQVKECYSYIRGFLGEPEPSPVK